MPLNRLAGRAIQRLVQVRYIANLLLPILIASASVNAQTPVLAVGQPYFYYTDLADKGITVNVQTFQTSTLTRIMLSVTTSNPTPWAGYFLAIPFHVISGSDLRQSVAISVTHSGGITTGLPQMSVRPDDRSPYATGMLVRSDGPFFSNEFDIAFSIDALSSPPSSSVIVDIGMGASAASGVGPGNGKLDFDGDGKSDYTVWRPSDGNWFLMPSGNSWLTSSQQWGLAFDIPVPGDYDGDGRTDYAVWRPYSGTWYIIPSSNPAAPYIQQWGLFGDTPVPADYDGDGKTDFAVWRPWNGTWYIIPSRNPEAPYIQQWGLPGDLPVPGDYDGDGKMDCAVWRPGNGIWYVIHSSDPANFVTQQWGLPGDVPVPGDYDGDGSVDYAVWRPANGTWYVIPSGSPTSPVITQWGLPGDRPVPEDFDGDGKTDYAVWGAHSFDGTAGPQDWFVLPSSNPAVPLIQQWGYLGDIPD